MKKSYWWEGISAFLLLGLAIAAWYFVTQRNDVPVVPPTPKPVPQIIKHLVLPCDTGVCAGKG